MRTPIVGIFINSTEGRRINLLALNSSISKKLRNERKSRNRLNNSSNKPFADENLVIAIIFIQQEIHEQRFKKNNENVYAASCDNKLKIDKQAFKPFVTASAGFEYFESDFSLLESKHEPTLFLVSHRFVVIIIFNSRIGLFGK